MSENPTGYRESPDTSDGSVGEGMVDGTPGDDVADAAKDARLTTDDDAQRDDSEARPGNTSD
jgi:hypothetical protein